MSKYDQVTAAQSADTDECILFDGSTALPGGYGQLTYKQKHYRVHKLSLCLATGEDYHNSPDGLEAAHTCGVAHCINPKHLYWATHLENMQDRVAHGNHPVGEDCNLNTAINSHVARAIYVACKVGPRGIGSTVAEYYGVSRSLVSLIANGKRWAHITVGVPIGEDEERISKSFFGNLKKYPELVEQWKYTHEGL